QQYRIITVCKKSGLEMLIPGCYSGEFERPGNDQNSFAARPESIRLYGIFRSVVIHYSCSLILFMKVNV
ncbi:MAG: hypothetical protein LBI62_05465, partial [Candidatus Accumulibacter sp.]|nr:hypothetical protein [Accumulibacter sp.]